jgi:NitT/TauT family transport system substrate-binding protein
MDARLFRKWPALGVFAALVLVVGCGGQSGQPAQPAPSAVPTATTAKAPDPLIIGTTGVTAYNWPMAVAVDQGFFKDAGIEASQVQANSTTNLVQALVSGSINVSMSSPDAVIRAIVQNNADIFVAGSVANKPVYTLMTGANINGWPDLRGKRVGVSAKLSTDGLWMLQMLKANGLSETDVEIFEIGGSDQRLAALKTNAIAATLLAQPLDFQALSLGFKSLALSTDIVQEITWNGYMTTQTWAKANEDLFVRYLAVMRRAHQWLSNSANRESAVRILVAFTKVSTEDGQKTYDLWAKVGTLAPNAEATAAGIQGMVDTLVQTKQLTSAIPVSRVLDTSYMVKAAKLRP